jgi:predicted 2-oxoglutarate/Fe(II)-dependent dioxygenase YbiX/peroxiredoxin
MTIYADPQPGDPAPYFVQRTFGNPRFAFDTTAGRYVVLCFLGSAADPHGRAAIDAVQTRPDIFDGDMARFFGVSVDPEDERQGRVADSYPGYRFFWDFDLTVSRLFGAAPVDAVAGGKPFKLHRRWVVMDPTLRVMKVVPFSKDGSDIEALLSYCAALPPPSRFAGVELQAPVIMLPNVFEPALCSRLVDLYEAHGGRESGFFREENGVTVGATDPNHKRRRDYNIEDKELVALLQARFHRRVVPEIAKVHQFHVTRMERFFVACYSEEDGGHFQAHRDNTTKGTAHRRFAVSVNLNDDFDGGELSFPEYSPRGFKMPPGCAVVFSCSLLHAVSKVTRGRRYAFLPFLYDDAAAELRERNRRYLAGEVGAGASSGALADPRR